MKELLYTYPPNPKNIINWMHYNEDAGLLLVHNAGLCRLDFFNRKGELLSSLDYNKRFGVMAVYKAIDHHPKNPWVAIAGREKWIIYDYQKGETLVKKKGSYSISGINFNPQGTELWLIEIDKECIDIYDTVQFEVQHTIPINASLAFPTRFHTSGDWFTYAELERGGTRIMFGNPKTYELIDPKSFGIETTSYNITGLTFSPCGNYLIFTDEGIHVYEFPSLNKKYIINDECEPVQEWASNQYPEIYWSPPIILKEKLLISISSGLVCVFDFETGKDKHDLIVSIGKSHYSLNLTKDNQLLTSNDTGDLFWINPTKWLQDVVP
jgi:hypothetical protein